MTINIDAFKPSGENGEHFYSHIYYSTTGQLIGTTQAGVTVVLGDVNSATNNVTTKAPADVTQATQTDKSGGITFPIKASETMFIEGDILLNNAAVGNIDNDFTITAPTSATATGSIMLGADEIYGTTDLTSAVTITCVPGVNSIHVEALVINSTTAGTVDLVFAHNTSATDVQTFKKESVLTAKLA